MSDKPLCKHTFVSAIGVRTETSARISDLRLRCVDCKVDVTMLDRSPAAATPSEPDERRVVLRTGISGPFRQIWPANAPDAIEVLRAKLVKTAPDSEGGDLWEITEWRPVPPPGAPTDWPRAHPPLFRNDSARKRAEAAAESVNTSARVEACMEGLAGTMGLTADQLRSDLGRHDVERCLRGDAGPTMRAEAPRHVVSGLPFLSPADAVLMLNELLAADPHAIDALVKLRVRANSSIMFHPTAQVGPAPPGNPPGTCVIGLLGVLNAIFGTRAEGDSGWIAAVFEGEDFKTAPIVRFTLLAPVEPRVMDTAVARVTG